MTYQKAIIPLVLIIGISTIIWHTLSHSNVIVDIDDYQIYLDSKYTQTAIHKIQSDRQFWEEKLSTDSENTVYLAKIASNLVKDFKKSGNIHSLQKADSILKHINRRIPNQASTLHALALNAITRHEFLEAEQYAKEAMLIGEKQYISQLLLTDINLERGNLTEAKGALKTLQAPQQFDYLIRNVKLQDQQGNLNKAIEQMESALQSARASGNHHLQNWAYSNLGDMYGHAGKIQQSYDTYLQALKLDPSDHHSLKGIAWIAFSHDRNPSLAKDIIHFLQSVHTNPAYHLFLAELAAWEGDTVKNKAALKRFISLSQAEEYGKMYTTYWVDIAPENLDFQLLLEADLNDRPHPSIFSLQTVVLLARGEKEKALDVFENKVKGMTSEPAAIYQGAKVYQANGLNRKAKAYYLEALEAAFELGPVVTRNIKAQLQLI
ncbi:MAG: tetratricopeptide repeat protein [Bacteroidota bacterium]